MLFRSAGEALRNNVYPIDDYVLRGLETQKRVAGTRKHFEYFAPMPGMAEMLLPPIKGRTHRIEAEVDTSGGGDGVILAAGGEEAGISLFVKNGYLTYVQNDLGRRSEEHTSELQSLMRISYAVF